MSAMQSIFGTTPTVQQVTPGNIPAAIPVAMNPPASTTTAANGVIPTQVNTDGTAVSSDAMFADLWKTDDTNQSTQGQPLFNVSREKLLETARLQDFKQTVTPEQMAAIQAGGPDAVNAMMDMINGVAQANYAQSVFATTKLIEGALDKSNFAKQDDLATSIRNLNFGENLRGQNPVFSNPVYAPLMETAKNQFQVKYPNATASELQGLAMQYVESMAKQFNAPAVEATVKKQQLNSTDWSKFVE